MISKNYLFLILNLYLVLFVGFKNANAQHSITGTITTDYEVPIENVYVSISGSVEESVLTDENGNYEFIVPQGGDYIIRPCYNLSPLNGVTTFDKVLITKHISGETPITSPYGIISADVDQDGSVSLSDEALVTQIVGSEIFDFPNNKSWRFIDKAYEFSDPLNPLSDLFPEEGIVNNLEDDITINFIGLKLGDLNHSAVSSLSVNSNDIASICFQEVTSDKSVLDHQREIEAFPNPFENEFFIPLEYNHQNVAIEIYTSSGRILSNHYFKNTDFIKLDLGQQMAGLYFVRIVLEDSSQWLTMVKH